MHPVIFGLVLGAAGLFASMFTAKAIDAPDVMVVGAALLFWIGVVALAWTRWVRKPARWLARLATIVGVVILATTVYTWIPLTDVFVDYRPNCPPRVGSFWKLAATWAAGAAAIHFSLFGQFVGMPFVRREPETRSALHWLGRVIVYAWSAACLYVLARNISIDVVLQSFKAAGGILIFIGIISAISAVVWFTSIPGRKRQKQAQADFEAIAPDRRRELVTIAERYARGVAHCLLYRETGPSEWNVRRAHVGWSALLPAGEAWPLDDEAQPGRFLLQLPLPDVLAAPWPGRSLALWVSVGGFDVVVRSYASTNQFVEVLQPPVPRDDLVKPVSKGNLLPLALPVPQELDDESQGDEFCELLLRECAELRDALAAITDQPLAVLPKLLLDDARAHYLEPGNGVWVGGEPQLIQNPHDAECEICKRPMRFLLSSSDFTEDMAFGDVGVAYVYGCDSHPEHCQAFVDCH